MKNFIIIGTCLIMTLFTLGLVYSTLPNQVGMKGCEQHSRINFLKEVGFTLREVPKSVSCVQRYYLDSSNVNMKSFEDRIVSIGFGKFRGNYSLDIKCPLFFNFNSIIGVGSNRGDVTIIWDKAKNLVEVVISQ